MPPPGVFFVFAFAFTATVSHESFANPGTCAVTQAPDPAFVPPVGWDPRPSSDGRFFYYGTRGLWAIVHNHWTLHGNDGNKLPYFSERYDWAREHEPRMTVAARRLDAPAPLVFAEQVNGASPSFRAGESPDPARPGFMVTSLHIPSSGCWQIGARYVPEQGGAASLSYTVLVEP